MQWERFPTWLVPLSAGIAVPHLVLSQRGFIPLTAHGIIQGSQSHILLPEPLAATKPASSQLCLFTLLPSTTLMVLHGVWYSPLLEYEYMWLTYCCQSHLSDVRPPVFSHITNGSDSKSIKTQLMWNVEELKRFTYIYQKIRMSKNKWAKISTKKVIKGQQSNLKEKKGKEDIKVKTMKKRITTRKPR